MAFLPGFEHDIFISYASVDDLHLQGEKGWVEQFHEHLELELSRRFGRTNAVKMWRDTEIGGNRKFDAAIQRAVEQSCLFLALFSPGFMHPDSYCPKELDWFFRKAQSGQPRLVVNERSRIVHALLRNIPYTRWPKEFAGTTGHPLHDAESDSEPGTETRPGSDLFRRQLRKLVDSLEGTLNSLRDSLSVSQPESVESSPGFAIFMADTADTLRSLRRRVAGDLRKEGLAVCEDVPPPWPAKEHDERTAALMKRAGLCVHLLDDFGGREVEAEPASTYPRRQYETAAELDRPRFVWVPRRVDTASVEDPDQRKFLERFEEGAADLTFVRGTPDSLVPDILDRISRLKSEEKAKSAGPAAALLDTHIKDQLHALQLSQYLIGCDIQPYINPEGDDPGKNMQVFAERLRQVSMLIVFQGAVSEDWVRARLGTALQLAISNKCPLRACGVYLAPPRDPSQPLRFPSGLLKIHVMDNTRSFRPETLQPLLSDARTGEPLCI